MIRIDDERARHPQRQRERLRKMIDELSHAVFAGDANGRQPYLIGAYQAAKQFPVLICHEEQHGRGQGDERHQSRHMFPVIRPFPARLSPIADAMSVAIVSRAEKKTRAVRPITRPTMQFRPDEHG